MKIFDENTDAITKSFLQEIFLIQIESPKDFKSVDENFIQTKKNLLWNTNK